MLKVKSQNSLGHSSRDLAHADFTDEGEFGVGVDQTEVADGDAPCVQHLGDVVGAHDCFVEVLPLDDELLDEFDDLFGAVAEVADGLLDLSGHLLLL